MRLVVALTLWWNYPTFSCLWWWTELCWNKNGCGDEKRAFCWKKPKYLQLSFGYSKGPSKGSRSNEGGL